MLLCKKIRLEVALEDASALEFMQGKCRGLYNWWVMRLRDGEKWNFAQAKRSLQASKQHDPELESVYGKLLHEVYYRLDHAMTAFFRRVQAGEPPGFPRVRPRHNFFTLCYRASYLKTLGNTLILPTGGKGKQKKYPNVRATLTELPPPGFREVAMSRDARGNYFASFSYKAQEAEQGPVVAFDLGIKTLAVGVNEQGRVYTVGGFQGGRCYNKQLDKLRAIRDRSKKKSRRYIHLSKVDKRVSEQKRHKQKDGLHKASHLIAQTWVERTVVVGELSQRQMVMKEHTERNKHLNRTVLPMPLYKRTYRCENCGLVMDRDENSAHNILARFLARLAPHTGDPVRCAEVFAAINTFEHV